MAKVLTQAQKDALARGRAKRNDPDYRATLGGAKTRAQAEAKARAEGIELLDSLPGTEPPRDTAPKQSPAQGKPGRPAGYSPKGAELTKIRTGLVMTFTMLGMGISMADTYDGTVIATNAERLADAWTQVAEQNARVRKVLLTMLEGSAWGNAIMITAVVAIPISVHHGALPESMNDMARTIGADVPDDAAQPTRAAGAGAPHRGGTLHPLGAPAPAPPSPPPATSAAPDPGSPDVPEISYEDAAFPGYGGPPGRAA